MNTFVDFYSRFGLYKSLISQKSFVSSVEKYCHKIVPICEEKLIECDKALSNPNLTSAQRAKLEAERAKFDYNSKFHQSILENIQYIIDDAGGEVTSDVIEEAYAFIHKELLLDTLETKKKKLKADRETTGIAFSEETLADFERRQEELDKEEQEINEMYSTLSDKQKREAYKIQLEEYLAHQEEVKKRQEDAEKIIEIPNDSEATVSEKYVKRRLGSAFNPNMSGLSKGVKEAGDGISWGVTLSEKPKLYYSGVVSDQVSPEYGTKIVAFSYGTFNYSTLYNDNKMPFYTDSISEVIGVTKTYPDNTKRTYMVIAPIGSLGDVKYATTDEIDKLTKEGKRVIPLMDRITYKKYDKRIRLSRELRERELGVRDLKSSRDRSVINFNYFVRKSKLKRFYDDLDEYEAGLKRPVLIRKTGDSRCPQELQEFAGSVYFSDYLLDNAVANNGGYLGTMSQEGITYGAPFEEERIRACFYANTHKGKAEQLTDDGITEVVQVSDLSELLKAIAPVQEKYAKKFEDSRRYLEGR